MESPISASLGAMGPLLQKLDMLLLEPSKGLLRLHKGAKQATHLLKADLEEITSYLEDLSEVEDPPLTAKCWMKEVRELSYDIENYIDSFVLPGHIANIKTRSGRRRHGRCRCRRIRVRQIKISRLLETSKKPNRRKQVAARISDFRMDAREALERHKRYELHHCAGIRRVLLPAAERLPATCEQGSGIIIDDRMREFMDSMADDRDPQLKVVSVVGSEGIGKTTLVKVLYHKLKGQFDCRAFIRLTRKPDIKTVLHDILTQVQKQQPNNHCDDPDLLGKIREHLQYKRYLIVIDDLWSASIWDVISYAFPGGKICSRIITTTPVEDVALACCYYHSEYVFKMRPLDEDLSRKIFFNSLFCPENDFPQKFEDVLSKIVKICSGLPLAINVIASLLTTHPVILMEQWTYIYDSLNSKLRTSSSASEGMKLAVNFSYNNLTCHLKTCLLYLSMYPEVFTVCKDDLVKQWVAEGFICGTEGREVETAESYFHELIGRRFLQPECIKYTGEVASCSVPEVVRDLIAQKSLEENFVVILDHYRRNVSLSEKVHRLSLHFPHTKLAMTNIRLSQVRSLTCFGLSKCMPSIREFKLLRVLNLNLSGHDNEDEDIIDLTWISELLHLRYLKVASDVCIELPKHMGGLQYLETVDISKKVTDVPSDIIHLPRLLHLHLPYETNLMDWLDMTGPAASSFGKPTYLQYLYVTCFIPVCDHLQRNILSILDSLIRGLGSLKTLAFIISSAHKNVVAHGLSEETVAWDWDDFAPPLLERFEWLLHSCSFSRVPKWIRKLGNLCILKISVRELMRDGVNILGELPALTTLSLYVKIPLVERIIFDKAGFSVLKYFKFKCSTLPWLKFEADAMPNLQKLKLGFSAHSHRVDQQSTVPISIEHLPSLKEISAKVADASSDAESALTAAISNHPRNPRIRMQLVDWNSYGHGVWYTVSKQENLLALEEHKIPDPEEGLDDHCVSQYKDSRDDQSKKAYVSYPQLGVSATSQGQMVMSSKYLKAAQELLDEVVSVSRGFDDANKTAAAKSLAAVKKKDLEGVSGGGTEDGSGAKSGGGAAKLSTAERQELQMKKSKLINMLDELVGLDGSSSGGASARAMSEEDEDQPPPKWWPASVSPPADQVLDNVLETVLQLLDAPRDRSAASVVCRSWHRAESATRESVAVRNLLAASAARTARRFPNARSLLLKGRPRFADFNLLPHGWDASAFRPWVAAVADGAFPALASLYLKRIPVTDADLGLLSRSLPASFRDLTLHLCDGFTSRGLASVASHCRGLRVLDVVECDMAEEQQEAVDWVAAFPPEATNLESLSFECYEPPVAFDALEALVARSPRLSRLRVNQHVSLGQLRRLMERAPRLSHLGTGSFRPAECGEEGAGFGEVVNAFVSAGRARTLVSLSGFRDLAQEYLPTIAVVCAHLKSLDLSYTAVTPNQILKFIGQCYNLETLWVLDSVRDEGLEAVGISCKKLQSLRVFPLHAPPHADELVSEVGLTAISRGCPALRSILYFCQTMTNAAVIAMSRNCPELKVFRLCIMRRHQPDHAIGEPMDEGFGAIVQNCSKLTRLSTSGQLTDRAFEYIGRYGKSLRTLSVAFAGNSDVALQYILRGCSKLEKLEIRDCPFGDAGLLSGMHHFYNMRFVWMSGCNLTLQGCKQVAQGLPRMVVELINGQADENERNENVDILYMYRSLDGPREDVPPFVKIL